MKISHEKAQKISNVVIDLEIIDRIIASLRSEITKSPLTPKQLDIMGLLVRNPAGLSIKAIAKELSVSSSAVVQVIDSFEGRKFIDRKSPAKDKRTSIAFIGETGQQYIKENLQKFTTVYDERIFGALSPKEFDEFKRLTHKIVDYAQANAVKLTKL